MNETSDRDFYADSSNQEPLGPPTRRRAKALTTHVPVRFSPETIAAVRKLAALDDVSVSTWIRRVVKREVERQLPPITEARPGTWEPTEPAASLTQPIETLDYVQTA